MNTKIFYFSGSGYSFIAARDISEALGAELSSVKNAVNSPPDLSSIDCLGFVFPVYHASYGLSGLPFIVERFLDRLENLEDKYIFGICTHGGKPGTVLRNLDSKLRAKGGKLDYGTCLRLSVPYRTDEKIRAVFLGEQLLKTPEEDEEIFDRLYSEWKSICPKIAVRIEHHRSCVMTEGWDAGFLSSVSNILQIKIAKARYRELSESDSDVFEVLVNRSDAGFRVNSNCQTCGLCERICPVGNITLGDSGPERNGACENCFACYHWCPENAVGGPLIEFEKQVTPPGVNAKDLI